MNKSNRSREKKQIDSIFDSYFLLNGAPVDKSVSFEDASIGNEVANEINKLMNELPEVIEAKDLMTEEELKEHFSDFAKDIAKQVKFSMLNKIPDIVDEVTNELLSTSR